MVRFPGFYPSCYTHAKALGFHWKYVAVRGELQSEPRRAWAFATAYGGVTNG